MTNNKLYPTINYKGKSTPFERKDVDGLVARIEEHLPSAKCIFYGEYEANAASEKPIYAYNVIVVPYDSQYDVHSKFDFHAFRIRLCGNDLSLSCWLSRIVDLRSALNYHRFDHQEIEEIWDNSKDIETESRKVSLLNYLLAVDVIADYYELLKIVIGRSAFTEVVFDLSPLQYFWYEKYDAEAQKGIADKLLLVIESARYFNLPGLNDLDMHKMAVSRYPSVVEDIHANEDMIRLHAKTIDEYLATWLLDVRKSVRGATNAIVDSLEHYGETFSAIYLPLQLSRLNNDNLEAELLAGLWKALDSGSLAYSYERTSWGGNDFMRAYFRPGENLHPLMKSASIALAIIDEWAKVTNEEHITALDLDQLLAIMVVPTSLLCITRSFGHDFQFIDLPSDNTTTLFSANNGRYTPVIASLIRLKFISLTSADEIIKVEPSTEALTSFIPLTAYYNEIRQDVRVIINIYSLWRDWMYNPIVNHCFQEAFSHKKEYIKTWTERAIAFLSKQTTEEDETQRLTGEVYRLSMMTQIINDGEFEEIRNKIKQGSTEEQLIYMLSNVDFSNDDCGLFVMCFAKFRYWMLYVSLFIQNDKELAKNVFYDLTHFANVQPEDSIKALFDDNGELCTGIEDNKLESAKGDIVNVISFM